MLNPGLVAPFLQPGFCAAVPSAGGSSVGTGGVLLRGGTCTMWQRDHRHLPRVRSRKTGLETKGRCPRCQQPGLRPAEEQMAQPWREGRRTPEGTSGHPTGSPGLRKSLRLARCDVSWNRERRVCFAIRRRAWPSSGCENSNFLKLSELQPLHS